MTITLKQGEKTTIDAWETIPGPRAAIGIQGHLTFTVDDPSIVTLTDNGDNTALLVAGNTGTATVTASGLDTSNDPVTATLTVNVTSPDPVTVNISEGPTERV